jgi:hypothetical protein
LEIEEGDAICHHIEPEKWEIEEGNAICHYIEPEKWDGYAICQYYCT